MTPEPPAPEQGERDEVLRTPDEWLALKCPGWQIMDPDGWRMADAPPFDAKISEREFGWRFARCTVLVPPAQSPEGRETR